jgi:hypothetical protein
VGLTFVLGFAIAGAAIYAEPHFNAVGLILWPGEFLSIFLLVLLRVPPFEHPHLWTALDILFDGTLYALLLLLFTLKLVRRGQVHHRTVDR